MKIGEERIQLSLSKALTNIGKKLSSVVFHKMFCLLLWTGLVLAFFHVSGKTPWLSKDLKIWARGSVIESPQLDHTNWDIIKPMSFC